MDDSFLKKLTQDDDVCVTDDGLVFNPFNSLNREITLNDVQSILKEYGLPPIVNNLALYKRAFVHRSYTKRPHFENIQHIPQPKPTSAQSVMATSFKIISQRVAHLWFAF